MRLKALEGLQPYVGEDQHVRDAVLEVLMHDANAEVRTRAISLLTPVQADTSVRQVLRTVSTRDDNPGDSHSFLQRSARNGGHSITVNDTTFELHDLSRDPMLTSSAITAERNRYASLRAAHDS